MFTITKLLYSLKLSNSLSDHLINNAVHSRPPTSSLKTCWVFAVLYNLTPAVTCFFFFQWSQGPVSRKHRKLFGPTKPSTKSRTLRLQSCFILVFWIWTEVLFVQEVSGAYSSLFLDTDEIKMACFYVPEKSLRLSRNGPLFPLTSYVWLTRFGRVDLLYRVTMRRPDFQ